MFVSAYIKDSIANISNLVSHRNATIKKICKLFLIFVVTDNLNKNYITFQNIFFCYILWKMISVTFSQNFTETL